MTNINNNDKQFKQENQEYTEFDFDSAFASGKRVDKVDNAYGRFGYSMTNPIPVNGQDGELDYLARLRCQCGESFSFHRVGSYGIGPDGHVIDGYEVCCKALKHRFVLYMDMYHEGYSNLVPEGLSKGDPQGIGLPYRVNNFPEGLINALIEHMNQDEWEDEI